MANSHWRFSAADVLTTHLLGATPSYQASDTLATEAGALDSSPLCVGVARFNLVTRQKKAFGRTLEVGIDQIGGDYHFHRLRLIKMFVVTARIAFRDSILNPFAFYQAL
jgi:hypothetical protein